MPRKTKSDQTECVTWRCTPADKQAIRRAIRDCGLHPSQVVRLLLAYLTNQGAEARHAVASRLPPTSPLPAAVLVGAPIDARPAQARLARLGSGAVRLAASDLLTAITAEHDGTHEPTEQAAPADPTRHPTDGGSGLGSDPSPSEHAIQADPDPCPRYRPGMGGDEAIQYQRAVTAWRQRQAQKAQS